MNHKLPLRGSYLSTPSACLKTYSDDIYTIDTFRQINFARILLVNSR